MSLFRECLITGRTALTRLESSAEMNVPTPTARRSHHSRLIRGIPGIIPGANPFAQSEGSFDPGKGPLLNVAAFENTGPQGFQFNFGQGPRISNLRAFGFHNQDIGLVKNTRLTERLGVQFRAEFFNIWNWHVFACQDQCFGSQAFSNDPSSPSFGEWNGAISAPRNIQFAMKLIF